MTDNRNHAGFRGSENDELDRVLDAALAKHAAVEPRAGLEERILANLRAERAKSPDRNWWRRSLVTALAAVVVVAVALAWRSSRPSHPTIANHPATTIQRPLDQGTRPVPRTGSELAAARHAPIRRSAAHRAVPAAAAAVAVPKLDQFPSPRPLSEQEKMALEYVQRFPHEAAMIAQAQTALMQREELERYGPQPTEEKPENHQEF